MKKTIFIILYFFSTIASSSALTCSENEHANFNSDTNVLCLPMITIENNREGKFYAAELKYIPSEGEFYLTGYVEVESNDWSIKSSYDGSTLDIPYVAVYNNLGRVNYSATLKVNYDNVSFRLSLNSIIKIHNVINSYGPSRDNIHKYENTIIFTETLSSISYTTEGTDHLVETVLQSGQESLQINTNDSGNISKVTINNNISYLLSNHSPVNNTTQSVKVDVIYTNKNGQSAVISTIDNIEINTLEKESIKTYIKPNVDYSFNGSKESSSILSSIRNIKESLDFLDKIANAFTSQSTTKDKEIINSLFPELYEKISGNTYFSKTLNNLNNLNNKTFNIIDSALKKLPIDTDYNFIKMMFAFAGEEAKNYVKDFLSEDFIKRHSELNVLADSASIIKDCFGSKGPLCIFRVYTQLAENISLLEELYFGDKRLLISDEYFNQKNNDLSACQENIADDLAACWYVAGVSLSPAQTARECREMQKPCNDINIMLSSWNNDSDKYRIVPVKEYNIYFAEKK